MSSFLEMAAERFSVRKYSPSPFHTMSRELSDFVEFI